MKSTPAAPRSPALLPVTPGQSGASATSAAPPRIPPAFPRRVRIHIAGASPCDQCTAACCKQNGHDYAALLQGDDETRKFAAFSIDVPIQTADGRLIVERVLPYVGGRCQFLGADERCAIYDDRPRACRAFECVPQFNRDGVGLHGPFLRRNPQVLAMLQELA